MSSSLAASRLIRFVPIRRSLIASNGLRVIGAFGLLAAALSGCLSVALAVGAMFAFTLGAGTASPMAPTEAISLNPKVIGSASGLYGFSQMTGRAGLGQSP
jgi:DHA1 family bicyclomycin/chloramphenicol resistance-like MFS transporter